MSVDFVAGEGVRDMLCVGGSMSVRREERGRRVVMWSEEEEERRREEEKKRKNEERLKQLRGKR